MIQHIEKEEQLNARNALTNNSHNSLSNIQGIAKMASGEWSRVRREAGIVPT